MVQFQQKGQYQKPGGYGLLPGWSPDGKQVGFGGYGMNDILGLWIADIPTGRMTQIAAGSFTMPAWSPDGSKLLFDVRLNTGMEIWMIEAKALADLNAE